MSDTAVVKAEPQTVDAGQLIAQAIDKNLPIESMERLLAMRRELKAEAAKEAFFFALSTFQSECPEIQKTKVVMNKDRKTIRYKYAPLDTIIAQVKKPLKDNGFSYTIKTEQENGSVTAICRLHHIEGHTEETQLTVPVDKESYMSAPQQIAAALTYAKRYAFCDATGIMTADEDNDAQPKEEPKEELPEENKVLASKLYKMVIEAVKAGIMTRQEGATWQDDIKQDAKSLQRLQSLERHIYDRLSPKPDDHADEVEGTVEDGFEPQAEELPLNDKVVLGKNPEEVKEIF